MDENNKIKLKKIKMLAMDVDGTLTDGAMYYTAQGDFMKRFFTRDGMGIDILHRAGFLTALLTNEDTQIVVQRAKKLKINKVVLAAKRKDEELTKIAEEFGLELEEIAYIGDDVNDISAMKIAGFRACPADASDLVKPFADIILTKNGGNGAVRELCEMILNSQEIAIY